ncbi:hypothetical protein [Limnobacter sp.]|uniref:hypothetical protein n=1 Tax=Limnobacter sp. TaxID=2003368 RepID=UPI0025BCD5E5|nr:hypothetical protein [Limnobacter sp.]
MAFWQFRPLNPNDNSGVSTVEDNFANEERTSVEILVRETLQNPLDARENDQLVEVHYNLVTLNCSSSIFLKALLSESCLQHFTAGGLVKPDTVPESMEFLVVEDFGTTGLEGCYTDSSVDGQTENWNAFWFREGEGAKPTRSNGGAGQGKITLYAASEIRSVLALTHRASDGKQLTFGCCRFRRNYKLPGSNERWAKEARWGRTQNPNDLALPIEDSLLIESIKDELGLRRQNKHGTTFIVPMPVGIALDELKKAVLNEFFFPIRRGRLKVSIGDVVIDSDSVATLAAGLGNHVRYPADYRKFLEQSIAGHIGALPTAVAKPRWVQSTKLSDDAFDAEQLDALKKSFERSEIVSVDFPVKIRKKKLEAKEGRFRVVLQQYPDGDQSHELFVRQDLGIDGEKRLKGSRRIQPVLSLTFIDDFELSGFLVAAEEPTHRTWNASRPKVMALYEGTAPLMNAVRNAALRLVEFLTPDGVRDTTALSLYFADPQSMQTKQRGARGDNPNSPNAQKKSPPDIPPPKPKPIEFKPLKDGFLIKAIPSVMETKRLPLQIEVRTAYATTHGDPFKQWDAAEYWLNNETEFPIEAHGASGIVRDGNEIHFSFDEAESTLRVAGFDPNRKVEVQINYRESDDAEDFEDD